MKKFTTKLNPEQLRNKIQQLHEHENDFNREISEIDKRMRQLIIRKNKLAKNISRNVIYRNNLINCL